MLTSQREPRRNLLRLMKRMKCLEMNRKGVSMTKQECRAMSNSKRVRIRLEASAKVLEGLAGSKGFKISSGNLAKVERLLETFLKSLKSSLGDREASAGSSKLHRKKAKTSF